MTTEKVAIDKLKKSGDFDLIRKEVLRQWEASAEGAAFRARLRDIVTDEVNRDTGLLERDRGKAATLVAGAVERYDT